MVVSPTAHPAVLSAYPGPLLFTLQRWVEDTERSAVTLGQPLLPTGGSVAIAAFSFLGPFGAIRLWLLGLDLAWTGSRTYAQPTQAFQGNRNVTRLTPAHDD